MLNITKYFANGLRNSIQLRDNGSFSHNGPWKQMYDNTLVARWHNGEFSSAEFTISIDYDTGNKEIIKCLVCNGVDTASVIVYGRNNLGNDLAELTASVNASYIDLNISPADPAYSGAKFIFTAQYFSNQTPLST